MALESKQGFMKNLKTVLQDTWKWDKKLFGMFFIYMAAGTVTGLVSVYLVKLLVDEITNERRIHVLLLIVLTAAFFQLAAALVTTLSDSKRWYRFVMIRIHYLLMRSDKLMNMSLQDSENPKILDLLHKSRVAVGSHISGGGAGVEGYLSTLFQSGSRLLLIFSYLGILVAFDYRLTLLIAATAALEYLLNRSVSKQEHAFYDKVSPLERRLGHFQQSMVDAKSGKDIRVFGLSKFLLGKYDQSGEKVLDAGRPFYRKQGGSSVLLVLINIVRYGIISIFLFWAVKYKGLTIGDYSMILAAAIAFSTAMSALMKDLAEILRQSLFLEDYFTFMALPEQPGGEKELKLPASGGIELELIDVSFTYPGAEKPVLEHLSLKLPAGKRLALVGVNGAGKTTLIKLLTGLYTPTSGKILLNGEDMKDFRRRDWYGLFSVVFQDVNLFAWTLSENVGMCTAEKVDEKKLTDALELAGLTEWVETLPKGVKTNLLRVLDEDGVELSGGLAQKLALARALYRDGAVVILDEPTAALDPIAEARVYESFDQLLRQKSGIYVSHRLSSTRFCDAVAFLEEGRITEYGSHQELMEKGLKYAEMFLKQASYYQEEEAGI